MESSHSQVHYASNSSRQEDEAGDKFGALPDDILVDIVSRLDLRTTVRAGAVSRRWRHIPRSLFDLNIDVYDLLSVGLSPRSADMAMTAYAAATSWLLAPSTRRTVTRLGLRFYLVDPHLQAIGRAVEDVAERGGLEMLQFTIPATPGANLDLDDESFGQVVMSFFDAYPAAFECLTSLKLEKIQFSESVVSALLNTCIKLRYLSLTECDSGPGSPVKIDAPNSEICILKLESSYPTVELVNVPKLVELHCHEWWGDGLPTGFGNVPCLTLVSVSFPRHIWQEPFKLNDWLPNCRNLSNLSLDFKDKEIWIKPEGPRQLSHMFSNLRVVSLYNVSHDCDLNWTLFVLEAAPCINNFLVKISWHTCDSYKCEDDSVEKINVPWDASNFQHSSLTLLQIQGFFVEKMVMRYVRLIIRHVVGLKKIRLLKQDPPEKCGSSCKLQLPTRLRFSVQEREKNKIKERLTDELSSSVQISIE